MPKSPKISPENFLGIKNPKWWFQETPGVFGLCYQWMKAYTEVSLHYQKGYEIIVVPFSKDYFWQVLEEKNSIEVATSIVRNCLKNPEFLDLKIEAWKVAKKELFSVFKKINHRTIARPFYLWKLYNNLLQSYINVFSPTLVIESFEPYLKEIFYTQFSHLDKETRQKLSLLEQPEFQSFIAEQQKSFLRLAQEIFQNKKLEDLLTKQKNLRRTLKQIKKDFPLFEQKLKQHTLKFFWIKNSYKGTYFLTPLFFLKQLVSEIKERKRGEIQNELAKFKKGFNDLAKRKEQVAKELKLDRNIISVFRLLNIIAWWQDERKKIVLIANGYLNLLLKKIARVKNLSLVNVQYLHPKEIKKLLLKNEYPGKNIVLPRRRFSIWIGTKNKEHWFIGKEAQAIKKLIFKSEKLEKKAISGIPASPGTVVGRCRIVLDPAKDKFYPDEILITSMTRPEFVPLMKKAKAIVTNEGGITCHAAIISRELGIPCVVGTKIATRVFKDGDLIEVRAHRGSVTKL